MATRPLSADSLDPNFVPNPPKDGKPAWWLGLDPYGLTGLAIIAALVYWGVTAGWQAPLAFLEQYKFGIAGFVLIGIILAIGIRSLNKRTT